MAEEKNILNQRIIDIMSGLGDGENESSSSSIAKMMERIYDGDFDEEELKSDYSGDLNVTVQPNDPEDFSVTFGNIKDAAMNLSRMDEQGFVNESTGASIVVRKNGQINLSASGISHYKLNPQGQASELSAESITYANRKKFVIDEFIINGHKMNPNFWQMSDFRKVKLPTNPNALIGNFCVEGSMLVKAWDSHLNRYMLIRRPVRTPMFGVTLNTPVINKALGIEDPLSVNEEILAKSNKGYQVNALIKDAASLIGKEGVDRNGSGFRSEDALQNTAGAMFNAGNGVTMTSTLSTVGMPPTALKNNATTSNVAPTSGAVNNQTNQKTAYDKTIVNKNTKSLGGGNYKPENAFNELVKLGYSEEAACGIIGNIQQDSGFTANTISGLFGNNPDTWDKYVEYANKNNKQVSNPANQLAFIASGAAGKELTPKEMNSNIKSAQEAAYYFAFYHDKCYVNGSTPSYGSTDLSKLEDRKAYSQKAFEELSELGKKSVEANKVSINSDPNKDIFPTKN